MDVTLEIISWLIALAWVVRVAGALEGLPRVPNLLLLPADAAPAGAPSLTVVVPARNEGRHIRDCLETLLQQDYAGLRIIAVDDRSDDETGAVMDALAALHPDRLSVLHVTELPAGWLGKTHAMAMAARGVETDYLLFTDADVLFHPAALRLALVNAQATGADHMIVMPTTIIRRWDEAGLLAFFQILGLWAVRTWKVADPAARDALGIGAFNMIRSSAYRTIGGFESFPMEIVEDIGLGRRVKRAGLRQRVAFGRGLVSVHWAAGVPGLVNVMTKNMFSALNFHAELLLMLCGWLFWFMIWPFCAVFVPGCAAPALLTIAGMVAVYVVLGERSGLSAWNVLLAPFAGVVFCYALLKSMVTTLRQGGVIWRGTFYPLAELRRHMVPLRRAR